MENIERDTSNNTTPQSSQVPRTPTPPAPASTQTPQQAYTQQQLTIVLIIIGLLVLLGIASIGFLIFRGRIQNSIYLRYR